MSSKSRVADYLVLRKSALWQLLASNQGPYVIAILQAIFHDDRDRRVQKGSSVLAALGRELSGLRDQGLGELARRPQDYLNAWVSDGYLIRRFPPGSREDEYELSAPAIDAIRVVSGMLNQRVALTESRLAMVIQAMERLSDDSDPDAGRRAERLREERDRIGREIARLESGQATMAAPEVSLERAREIIDISQGLTEDFRLVQDRFVALHQRLRERLLVFDESRGQVAGEVFEGIHEIEGSEDGRSFDSFFAMLMDEEQRARMTRSLGNILEADFFAALDPVEQDYLKSFDTALLRQSMLVQRETTRLGKGLRELVQSRSYRERRRLLGIITEAREVALGVKEIAGPPKPLDLDLSLTSVGLGSVSQVTLFDPSQVPSAEPMRRAEGGQVDLGSLSSSIRGSEIDYPSLRRLVAEAAGRLGRASIADILGLFPATQGLGTVVGLVHLAHRHGERGQGRETVGWLGLDGFRRAARIDRWLFSQERLHELS
ncbi:MAG: DUF3375 domain-containing protein [Deltaproteobacteria bacterium]|jgi:hypothetical protein|nr:DUF3375 domain-containing protein [Deltaproteobacteria bacterium]